MARHNITHDTQTDRYQPDYRGEVKPLNTQTSCHTDCQLSECSRSDNESIRQRQRFLDKIDRNKAVLFIIAIICSSALGISVYSLCMYSAAANELRTARANQGKVCLPCDDMEIQLDSWKVKDSAGDCCVQLQELLALMNLVAKERAADQVQKAEERMAARLVSLPSNVSEILQRVSAHIGVDGQATGGPKWLTDQYALGHITKGLLLVDNKKGKIKVEKGGNYFIYSQMVIRLDVPEDKERYPFFKITLVMQEPEISREKIVATRQEMTWNSLASRSYSIQTSYIARMIYIPSGATVYLKTDPSSVMPDCNYEDCYFGLFKL